MNALPRSLATLLFVGVLAGCSSAEETSSAHQSIIGGTVDPDDPSVVLIGGGGVWCTGTLIAPEVVLTAAHCIGPTNNFVYFGSWFLGDAGSTTLIAQSYQHPDYATNKNADIGVVILSTPSAVPPAAVNTTALGPSDVGAAVHVVGFGDTASPTEPSFTKMQVTVPITSITADAIMTGPAICSGDSGGPAMLSVSGNPVVAGVVSGHSIQACGGTAGYVRVDLYAAWIQQQIDLAEADAGSGAGDAGTDDGSASSDAGGNDGGVESGSEPNGGTSSAGCTVAAPPPTPGRAGVFGALLIIACGAWRRRRRHAL